jgi:hypothetical protein
MQDCTGKEKGRLDGCEAPFRQTANSVYWTVMLTVPVWPT